VLGLATLERRAIVTENVAVAGAASLRGSRERVSYFGIVFISPRQFPRTRRAIGRMVRALDALLVAHPSANALRDQTWWLEPFHR